MDRAGLLTATKHLIAKIDKFLARCDRFSCPDSTVGPKAEVCEFLKMYGGGATNSFYMQATGTGDSDRDQFERLRSVLSSFQGYVEAGLHAEITPERRAQLDVVSDLLDQARILLESKDVHPAAPTVLIGATLEEFLRTWTEALELKIGTKKPGLQTYSDMLREAGVITKQDAKDISGWGGLRNLAAHGEWEEVKDRSRINLMLDGVNLFMRQYGAETSGSRDPIVATMMPDVFGELGLLRLNLLTRERVLQGIKHQHRLG